MVVAVWFRHTTGQQERLIDACLALIAGDPVNERCLILDDSGGKMRHDLVAVARQPPGGRDHIRDWSALDMGDVNPGPFRQEIAEILDLFGGPRHDLDGIILKKRLKLGVHPRFSGVLGFAE